MRLLNLNVVHLIFWGSKECCRFRIRRFIWLRKIKWISLEPLHRLGSEEALWNHFKFLRRQIELEPFFGWIPNSRDRDDCKLVCWFSICPQSKRKRFRIRADYLITLFIFCFCCLWKGSPLLKMLNLENVRRESAFSKTRRALSLNLPNV